MMRMGAIAGLLGSLSGALCALAGEPIYVPYSTAKVMQVTGDYDHGWRMPTPTRTGHHGLFFSDLGSSFEHKGRLALLFGDSFVAQPEAPHSDLLAFSDATEPQSFDMELLLRKEPNVPLRIDIPGIREAELEVPSHGISVGGDIYLVFTTGSDGLAYGWNDPDALQMREAWMCRSRDDGRTWEKLYLLSGEDNDSFADAHFINVGFVKARGLGIKGLPPEVGDAPVLVYGTGKYRKSAIYLAVTSEAGLADKSSFRFFAGMDGTGLPRWSQREADAVPVMPEGGIGEFSADFLAPIGKWLLLYTPENVPAEKRGVTAVFADAPWGPFGEPQVIFKPWRDRGYTEFMHVDSRHGRQDTARDPGRDFIWGGEYAPYIVSRFTRHGEGRFTLYYLLSTWNPYQVVMMESTFSTAGLEDTPAPYEAWTMPGGTDWTTLKTSPFFSRTLIGLEEPVLDFAPEGMLSKTGALWWKVPEDPRVTRLEFQIWGGDAEAILIEGGKPFPEEVENVRAFYDAVKSGEYGRVVRVAAGLRSSSDRLDAMWHLTPYRRDALRLLLIDPWDGGWGGGMVNRIRLANEAAGRWDGIRASLADPPPAPYDPAAAVRHRFDSRAWSSTGEADAFPILHRFGRRYVNSLTERGEELSGGALVLTFDPGAADGFLSFFASGAGGEARLYDRRFDPAEIGGDGVLPRPGQGTRPLQRLVIRGGGSEGHRIVWPVPGGDGPYHFVVSDPAGAPGRFRHFRISEPVWFGPGSGPVNTLMRQPGLVTTSAIEVGTRDWNFFPGKFYQASVQDGTGHLSTFGPKGDAERGYLWFRSPAKPDVTSISFNVSGNGGRIFLLSNEHKPFPPRADPAKLRERIEKGEFGKVLESATGKASPEPVAVTWDVSEHLDQGFRIVILDDADRPWGFLNVSDFKLDHQLKP